MMTYFPRMQKEIWTPQQLTNTEKSGLCEYSEMTFNWISALNELPITGILLFALVIVLFIGGCFWRMSYGKRDERRDSHKG